LIEKASESVTAKGSPSGIATTKTVIAIRKASRIWVRYFPAPLTQSSFPPVIRVLKTMTIKITIAEARPK
jgi:hypothetical protein